MTPLNFQQIRQVTSGRPLTPEPGGAASVWGITIDSRQKAGAPLLFVALRGERFDGHDFLAQATASGATAALVERLPAAPPPVGLYLLQVTDTYAALGQLARRVRQELRGKVIAVAGSNGKTGTKLLIDAALRGTLRGSISPKSFNNRVGVPLTIFPADPADDYLVLEMGTNHPGEIRPLSEMAEPDVAVITSVGAEHLEGLGDLDGVRRENAEILSGMKPDGTLIVNGDDAGLLAAVAHYSGRRVTFGFDQSNDLFAADVRCDGSGVRFRLNGRREVFVPLLGRHTAANALAAIAVGRRLAVPEDAMIDGLAHAEGPPMRLQLEAAGDVTLLNDAYNANPSSMRAAIETLAGLSPAVRRIAVLGDMRELGPASERYHSEIGEYAAAAGRLGLLACVGPLAGLIGDGAAAAGMSAGRIVRYPDARTAAVELPALLETGDLVLLKASRAIGLEAVAKAVVARRAAPPISAAV